MRRKLQISFVITCCALIVWLKVANSGDLKSWFPPEVVTFQFPIGTPRFTAASDFNNDSLTDLFVVTEVNSPQWLLGISDPNYEVKFYVLLSAGGNWQDPKLLGTFSAPNLYLLSSTVSLNDFDNDKHVDAIILLTFCPVVPIPKMLDLSNQNTYLIVFWGQKDGEFVMDHLGNVNVGFIPPLVKSGDFNGDGLADFAYSDAQNLDIYICYNHGNRQFSEPDVIEIAQNGDECVPIPGVFAVGHFDQNNQGDDLVVVGACVFAQDKYGQYVRLIISCGERCWNLSQLIVSTVRYKNVLDAFGAVEAGDFDMDGKIDVVFTRKAPFEDKNLQTMDIMDICFLKGDGQGGFQAPELIQSMLIGGLLAVKRSPRGHWEILALNSETNSVFILAMEEGGYSSTSIPVRGHVVGGIGVEQTTGYEIVVVSSLMKSEVTLVNVIRRRSG